jgi:threonine/homoserine/homoserine lactone efflux protein
MPDPTLWGLFVAASVVLLLTPGPAVLYIVARSVERGRAAGLVSVLGIHLGTIVHITAAAVGLSALIVSSALAFAVVKYLGAAYLIWIGLRTLMAKDTDGEAPVVPAEPLARVFRDGFVVNLFNPKTAIFFLAFLPQFVDPAKGHVAAQIVLLGTFFNIGGTAVNCAVAWAGSAASRRLKASAGFERALRWLSATVFAGLALRLAVSERG